MGVGSGITISSDAEQEYRECLLKADFLKKPVETFSLIETMLWEPFKGFYLLPYHMNRLFNSSRYFDFHCDREAVLNELLGVEKTFDSRGKHRVRLLLSKSGNITVTSQELPEDNRRGVIPKVKISEKRVDSANIYLYHKTTNRTLYDSEYRKFVQKGYFDVIFLNEKDEITEGAVSNVIIKSNNRYSTPPISSGLLDGTYRQYLIKEGQKEVKQQVLYKRDLINSDEIYLANSVRKMTRVVLE
jgi:para-aminobenzoate synthetase/4-amino-4-deoxychorismate lyase